MDEKDYTDFNNAPPKTSGSKKLVLFFQKPIISRTIAIMMLSGAIYMYFVAPILKNRGK